MIVYCFLFISNDLHAIAVLCVLRLLNDLFCLNKFYFVLRQLFMNRTKELFLLLLIIVLGFLLKNCFEDFYFNINCSESSHRYRNISISISMIKCKFKVQ